MPGARLKSKVCLVGEKAVGKTSLIRRYVLDAFDDVYVRTLGAKVEKKTVVVLLPGAAEPAEVTMAIWDIMGHLGVQELLKDSFFHGAQGVLAVADLTRRDSMSAIPQWVEAVKRIAGPVPVVLCANKADLARDAEYGEREVAAMARVLGSGYQVTSAKTGANVEEAFRLLGAKIAERQAVVA